MQETRQHRISRLLQKELASIFQTQTRLMHGVLVSVTNVKLAQISVSVRLTLVSSLRKG